MSYEDPKIGELSEFAQLWASRVAAECPFTGCQVTIIVRHPTNRDVLGRCMRVAMGPPYSTRDGGSFESFPPVPPGSRITEERVGPSVARVGDVVEGDPFPHKPTIGTLEIAIEHAKEVRENPRSTQADVAGCLIRLADGRQFVPAEHYDEMRNFAASAQAAALALESRVGDVLFSTREAIRTYALPGEAFADTVHRLAAERDRTPGEQAEREAFEAESRRRSEGVSLPGPGDASIERCPIHPTELVNSCKVCAFARSL